MKGKIHQEIERLVRLSLAFHNLNKMVEAELGLSLVQYHCLAHIKNRPGISSQSLARAIGVHPSSLTSTIRRLGGRDLLFVGSDPKDSRKKMLSLTSVGKKMLDEFELHIEELLLQDERIRELKTSDILHTTI